MEARTAGSVIIARSDQVRQYGFLRFEARFRSSLTPSADAIIVLAVSGVIKSLVALGQPDIKKLVDTPRGALVCDVGDLALKIECAGGAVVMIGHGLSKGALFLWSPHLRAAAPVPDRRICGLQGFDVRLFNDRDVSTSDSTGQTLRTEFSCHRAFKTHRGNDHRAGASSSRGVLYGDPRICTTDDKPENARRTA